jgi:hypothetical protein
MLTGTALDLTPFGVVLQGIGIAYWLLVVAVLVLVLVKVKGRLNKLLTVATVLGIMVVPMALHVAKKQKLEQQQVQLREQEKARLDAAMARFEMRCKNAGEKIYRTVENVEGIFIMKQRPDGINFSDQYKLDDPYGRLGSNEDYIRLFLRGRPTKPLAIGQVASPDDLVRYRFVEIKSEDGAAIYQYTTLMGKVESEQITRNGGGVVPLEKKLVKERSSDFGITWNDISTKEDRDHWIAGSQLQIVDLRTHEIVAERIGYMFDRGLGDTAGGRSPWAFARENACPPLNEKTFYFFDRVLIPTKERQ